MRWNSAVPSGWDDFWIDPKTKAKDLGDGGANYQFNPADAKKLMSAAGHTSALATQYTYPPGQWGPAWDKQAEVMRSMLEEHGDFKLNAVTLNYQTEFRGKYFQGSDKHEGIAFMDSAPTRTSMAGCGTGTTAAVSGPATWARTASRTRSWTTW